MSGSIDAGRLGAVLPSVLTARVGMAGEAVGVTGAGVGVTRVAVDVAEGRTVVGDALGMADEMPTVGDIVDVAMRVGVGVKGIKVGELNVGVAPTRLSATLAMTTGACV